MIRFVLLLALLSAFPPLSTDMYLPAIPYLEKTWQLPLFIINLTLVFFFITYCCSMLVYGPLSDRFGRKPPLISGLLLFIAASLLCAFSVNIWMLIGARIIQGMGAGAASAISLAMARDRLPSGQRERVLSQISVIMALAPMISPMIGSLLLKFLAWNWIFATQAIMGLIALAGVFKTPETHAGSTGNSLTALLQSYQRVLRNRNLTGLVLCNAIVGLPLFAFIAGSASIYIVGFQLPGISFSFLFGVNALCFMAGSLSCLRFGKKIGTFSMISYGYAGIIIGGIGILFPFINGPLRFTLPMGLITFSIGLSRPPSNNLVLDQVKRDAGTASSVMVFSYFLFGALSMVAVSLDWTDKIFFIGCLAIASGTLSLSLWLMLKKHLHLPAIGEIPVISSK
ncbi:MAG: multidrug effflux MFS transporter [Desulfobulbaceae bacterium]|nr:multidrug effflux MFS transporter [Desulfobulbaceae bacterium]